MWRVIQSAKILQSTTEPCKNAILAGGRIIPIARSWDDLENKPFGVKTEMVELYTNDTIYTQPSMGDLVMISRFNVVTIEAGKKYFVRIKDREFVFEAEETNYSTVGDIVKIGADITGSYTIDTSVYPIAIYTKTNGDTVLVAHNELCNDKQSRSMSISIFEEQEVVEQLDPKFISGAASGGSSGVSGGGVFEVELNVDNIYASNPTCSLNKTYEEIVEAHKNNFVRLKLGLSTPGETAYLYPRFTNGIDVFIFTGFYMATDSVGIDVYTLTLYNDGFGSFDRISLTGKQ